MTHHDGKSAQRHACIPCNLHAKACDSNVRLCPAQVQTLSSSCVLYMFASSHRLLRSVESAPHIRRLPQVLDSLHSCHIPWVLRRAHVAPHKRGHPAQLLW